MKVLSACIHLAYNTETDSKSSSFAVNTLSWPGEGSILGEAPSDIFGNADSIITSFPVGSALLCDVCDTLG